MRVEEKKTKQENKEVIEITEDVRVPGTDVILEAGDRIEVLKETVSMPLEIISSLTNWINHEYESESNDEDFDHEEFYEMIAKELIFSLSKGIGISKNPIYPDRLFLAIAKEIDSAY